VGIADDYHFHDPLHPQNGPPPSLLDSNVRLNLSKNFGFYITTFMCTTRKPRHRQYLGLSRIDC
jgi:hypothetical protein